MLSKNIFLGHRAAFALAASAVLLGPGAGHRAMAQEPAVEQIIVVAPLIVEVKKPGTARPASGEAAANGRGTVFTVLSASSNVSFGDLDLTKVSGINMLEKRIQDTATATCRQLRAKYPESVYVPVKSTDCVKTATDQAMIEALQIIAASVR